MKYALNEREWAPAIFSRGDYELDNNLIEPMRFMESDHPFGKVQKSIARPLERVGNC